MVHDEKELFLRIAEGDETAFRHLFHLYNKQLVPFILKLTNSQVAAEEIIQEAFIKVWKNRATLAQIETPKAWMVRIVSNLCYNHLRKNAIEGRLFKAIQEKAPTALATPADLVAAKELEQIIQKGIESLPPQMRQVYLLNKEKGLSIAEIAAELNIAPQTVKNQLVTALKKLRIHLERNRLVLFL